MTASAVSKKCPTNSDGGLKPLNSQPSLHDLVKAFQQNPVSYTYSSGESRALAFSTFFSFRLPEADISRRKTKECQHRRFFIQLVAQERVLLASPIELAKSSPSPIAPKWNQRPDR